MGGLVGFVVGYYLGARDGPERLEELRRSLDEILASQEFRALRQSAGIIAKQALAQLWSQLSNPPASGPPERGARSS